MLPFDGNHFPSYKYSGEFSVGVLLNSVAMDLQKISEKVDRDFSKNRSDLYVLGVVYGKAEVDGYTRVVYKNKEGELAYYTSANERVLLPPDAAEPFTDAQLQTIQQQVQALQQANQQHTEVKANHHMDSVRQYSNPPKDKTTMLILSLLVFIPGIGGIHRLVSGHVATGIIQLLTAGGCYIWQIIDIIDIVNDKFVDAEGQKLVKN